MQVSGTSDEAVPRQEEPLPVPPASQEQSGIGTPPQEEEDATYEPFTQGAYDQAVANGDPIFLYFYANWCPFCKEQDPRNQRIFETYGKRVRGFRVNYNDSDTDSAERALAERFKVVYQHTGIYLKNGKDEAKRTIGTESDAALTANLDLITH